MAKGAKLIAVQVFTQVTDAASCGGIAPCPGAFTSDIIAGLEYVQSLAAARNVAAVNMSLGGGSFAANVRLPPGAHEYMFVVDGQWVTDPAATERRPDGFGRDNAVLRL